MLSLEVLVLRIALAGLHDVNLDVQTSWRAQYLWTYDLLKCRIRGSIQNDPSCWRVAEAHFLRLNLRSVDL